MFEGKELLIESIRFFLLVRPTTRWFIYWNVFISSEIKDLLNDFRSNMVQLLRGLRL